MIILYCTYCIVSIRLDVLCCRATLSPAALLLRALDTNATLRLPEQTADHDGTVSLQQQQEQSLLLD